MPLSIAIPSISILSLSQNANVNELEAIFSYLEHLLGNQITSIKKSSCFWTLHFVGTISLMFGSLDGWL